MYKEKYIKYKTKYIALKNQLGGNPLSFLEKGKKEPYYEKINYRIKVPFAINETFYIIHYSQNEIKLVNILFNKGNPFIKGNEVEGNEDEVEGSALHLSYENETFIITLFIPNILDPTKYRIIKLNIADIESDSFYMEIIVYHPYTRDLCLEIIKRLKLIKLIMLDRQGKDSDDDIKINELITLLDSFINEFHKLIEKIDSMSNLKIDEIRKEAIDNYNLKNHKEEMLLSAYQPIQSQPTQFKREDYKAISSPEDIEKIIRYEEEQRLISERIQSAKESKERRDKERKVDGPLMDNDYREDD